MRRKIENYSEKKIIAQAQKGDARALEDLIRANLGFVYSYSFWFVKNRDDAEDITQEVFIKVWRNLKKYDPTRPFRNWILEITRNTAFDFLKKRRPIPFSLLGQAQNLRPENLGDDSPTPLETTEQSLANDLLTSAIAKLPFAYQDVIKSHGLENLNFREIAELTGKSINTVKSRYRRAIIALKKLLLS